MKLESLRNLYIEDLRDIYNAENQLIKALPKMAKAASSTELKTAFEDHLEETKRQVERLDDIFEKLEMNPKGKKCKAMDGLIKEGAEFIEEDAEPSVKDAALIGAAQRVEHYEIACYGCARTYAQMLGENDAVELLQQSLDEEASADKKLTEIAESFINAEAVAP